MTLESASSPAPPAWQRLFVGPRGARALWRALGFVAVMIALSAAIGLVLRLLLSPKPGPWDSRVALIQESVQTVVALAATVLFARLERRSLATFGFDPRRLLSRELLIGALWGLGAVSLLVGVLVASGAARIDGLAVHGAALATPLGAWAVAMVLVGVSEELSIRGYLMWALTRGMGFAWASVLLALGFGALHYFGKPMENLADGVSVTLIGLFFSLTLRRTGNLSFAIGFHILFDWAALILFAAPNTINDGQPLPGHLLAMTYSGPAWLTGGHLGLEASAFIFPVIAALYLALQRVYPRAKWPSEDVTGPAR